MRSNLCKEHNHNTQVDAFSFFKAVSVSAGYWITSVKKNDIADGRQMITSLINKVKKKKKL